MAKTRLSPFIGERSRGRRPYVLKPAANAIRLTNSVVSSQLRDSLQRYALTFGHEDWLPDCYACFGEFELSTTFPKLRQSKPEAGSTLHKTAKIRSPESTTATILQRELQHARSQPNN